MDFFGSLRDLRQGDLLSPLFFVFIIEALCKMIAGLVKGGFLFGFVVGDARIGTLEMTHLLFVYDALIFYGADYNHIQDSSFACSFTLL